MNMKFAAVAALGALSIAAFAPQAAAADNGFYIGAGITQSEFEIDGASDSLDDNSFKIIVGYRPLDWLAVEANYIDLGGESFEDPDLGTFSIDATALSVSALAIAEAKSKPQITPASAKGPDVKRSKRKKKKSKKRKK